MRRSLLIAAGVAAAGLGLSACDISAPEREEEVAPPPPVEEPIVEEVEPETTPETTPSTTPPPPPSDTGDMGDARPSEESVEPDSETVFY